MFASLRLHGFRFALGLGVAAAAVAAPAASWAQSASTESSPFPDNERSATQPGLGSSGLSAMDLIHQAQRGERPSMGRFQQQNRSNLETASERFKQQQQRALQQQSAQESPSGQAEASQ